MPKRLRLADGSAVSTTSSEARPTTYWITGLPGSGKSYTATAFWRARGAELKEYIFRSNGLPLRVRISGDTALIGRFDDEDVLRNGTDRYGLSQRGQLKYLWKYLANNTEVKDIVVEGVAIINDPLMRAVSEYTRLVLVKIDVPLKQSISQHAKRERALIAAGRANRKDPKDFYTQEHLDKLNRKIQLQVSYAAEVVSCPNTKDALAYLDRMVPSRLASARAEGAAASVGKDVKVEEVTIREPGALGIVTSKFSLGFTSGSSPSASASGAIAATTDTEDEAESVAVRLGRKRARPS